MDKSALEAAGNTNKEEDRKLFVGMLSKQQSGGYYNCELYSLLFYKSKLNCWIDKAHVISSMHKHTTCPTL